MCNAIWQQGKSRREKEKEKHNETENDWHFCQWQQTMECVAIVKMTSKLQSKTTNEKGEFKQ